MSDYTDDARDDYIIGMAEQSMSERPTVTVNMGEFVDQFGDLPDGTYELVPVVLVWGAVVVVCGG